MIKFIHTADLHLGKVFHDQSLIEDQAFMLTGLASLLEDESYAALVIAGDVYDRSIPSPEAVELFSGFLGKLKRQRPDLEIFIIPGNHDSPARLGYGRELFAELGIRFGVSAADSAEGVIVKTEKDSSVFFLLPFLNSGDLEGVDPSSGEAVPLRSQAALAGEAARLLEKSRRDYEAKGVSSSVLVSHLFVSGGMEAGSERVFLGNAEQVNAKIFAGFDYVALGHLHGCQRAGENGWYSGSPLAYSFGEVSNGGRGEKCFLSVELKAGKAAVKKIPVKPLRSLASFSGPFSRFSGDISSDSELLAASNDYLELRLTDQRVTENARDILRRRFPRLLSLRQDEALAGLSSSRAKIAPAGGRGERQDTSADFRKFLESLYGDSAAEEFAGETELFDEILAEAEAEEASS